MSVWSGLGMNYKSVNNAASDIAYFNKIGIVNIRPHIPSYTDGSGEITIWRTLAKTFHDAGFWVTWGLSSSSVGSSTWDAMTTAILAEAATCQAQDVCDDFELGNEYELHLIDGWTEAGDLIPALKTLATSAQAVFTRGTISYSVSNSHISNWISAGKGDIDLIGLNTYGVISNHNTSASGYANSITTGYAEFGSNIYISEFNLDSDNSDFISLTPTEQERDIRTMLKYIKDSGIGKALFFQYRGYKDLNDQYAVRYANNTFRQMWNPMSTDFGRNYFIEE